MVDGLAMQIVKSLCRPFECSLECIEACELIHGNDVALVFDEKEGRLRLHENLCTQCLSCVRACPFGAIIVNAETEHKAETVTRTTPKQPSRRPYEVSDGFKKFPEELVVFARIWGDPSFKHYNQGITSRSDEMIAKSIAGYGRADLELSIALWKVYDSRKAASSAYEIKKPDVHRPRVTGRPEELTRRIKRTAKFLGAALVGIAPLDRRWIYSTDIPGEPYDIPNSVNRAIVIAVEMDYDIIASSPAWSASSATALGYSMMAFIEIELAEFIQRMGYTAIPCGNSVGMSVPLAIDAGLGQYGRHGILITREYGPRVRIAKILTDMPLVPDGPDLAFCDSVIEFCKICKKCAETCPSQSIPYDTEQTWQGKTKSNNPGIKKWYVNVETCYGFWVENGNECSNCIRSCPYNKPNNILHKMVLWTTQHMPWLNRLVIKMDDLFGYGRQKNPGTVWQKND